MAYKVWLVDHPPYAAYWSDERRASTANSLKAHFDAVCRAGKAGYSTTDVTWANSGGNRKPEHLVIHFFRRNTDGLLYMWGQRTGLEKSGATMWRPEKNAVVSEVYVETMDGDSNFGHLAANLAFHEAMHNKLDTYPTYSKFDVHRIPGGSLSRDNPPLSSGTPLSTADAKAMVPGLKRAIPQW